MHPDEKPNSSKEYDHYESMKSAKPHETLNNKDGISAESAQENNSKSSTNNNPKDSLKESTEVSSTKGDDGQTSVKNLQPDSPNDSKLNDVSQDKAAKQNNVSQKSENVAAHAKDVIQVIKEKSSTAPKQKDDFTPSKDNIQNVVDQDKADGSADSKDVKEEKSNTEDTSSHDSDEGYAVKDGIPDSKEKSEKSGAEKVLNDHTNDKTPEISAKEDHTMADITDNSKINEVNPSKVGKPATGSSSGNTVSAGAKDVIQVIKEKSEKSAGVSELAAKENIKSSEIRISNEKGSNKSNIKAQTAVSSTKNDDILEK